MLFVPIIEPNDIVDEFSGNKHIVYLAYNQTKKNCTHCRNLKIPNAFVACFKSKLLLLLLLSYSIEKSPYVPKSQITALGVREMMTSIFTKKSHIMFLLFKFVVYKYQVR